MFFYSQDDLGSKIASGAHYTLLDYMYNVNIFCKKNYIRVASKWYVGGGFMCYDFDTCLTSPLLVLRQNVQCLCHFMLHH